MLEQLWKARAHTHTHYIYIYIYIYMYISRNGRFGKSVMMRKVSGKVDKAKHRQRVQEW